MQKEKNQKAPVGVELIDNTLQIITQMQQQKKVLQAENDELKSSLQKLESVQSEGIEEKKKYMEGAVWMGKKLSNEIEKVCQSYEFLLLEYNQRIQKQNPLGDTQASEFGVAGHAGSLHGASNTKLQNNQDDLRNHQLRMTYESASNWLAEAVKQAGFDLYEKSITILESAIFHMDDANKALGDAGANWNHQNLVE